jgi:signal transduction histidine kinase
LANEFQPQAEAKKQLLVIGKTEDNAQVQGDALKLHQALRNLIGNAIKYTGQGGTVTLSMEKCDDTVDISIQDTGYGIPATDLPNVFKRFYRVRNNGHDDIEGNGLGLAIVKSIVEKHGGQVSVESEQGQGSCFHVLLPLLLSTESEPSEPVSLSNNN